LSAKQIGWALKRKTANPYAKLILAILADRSDPNGWSFMSQATIAKQAGLAKRSVIRMLAMLEQEGHIRRVQRFTKTGARTSDHIQLGCHFGGDTQSPGVVTESHTIPSSPYGVGKEEEKGLGVEVPSLTVVGGTET